MKRIALIASLIIVSFLFSCEQKEEVNLDVKTKEMLAEQLEEIISIAESVDCTDSQKWTYIPYGYKACGGPSAFIAYHTEKINVPDFLDKVSVYSKDLEIYVKAHDLASDCSIPSEPASIVCENNRPVFTY